MKKHPALWRLGSTLLAGLAIGGALGGCVAVAGGAMIGGTMMAVDRRSTGTQVDDQTIEVRAATTIPAAIGQKTGNVSATSYNRVLLLTGQVPTQADRAKAEAAAAKVENVRSVLNELTVAPNSTLTQQANDTIITGKVKAAFVDSKALQMASIKVVTENGVVYLMGRLTDAEAQAAADAARGVGGVTKVVKVFEPITAAELAALPVPPTITPAASAPAAKP